MNTSVIELKSIFKSYGSFLALQNLNLKVDEGSIFGFLGPNGAGKTTTIKIILGLRKATEGEVFLWGEKNTRRGMKLLKRIGYVPENGSLYENFTPNQIVKFVKPYYPSWDVELEKGYFERFELPKNKKIGEFSLGMKRKLLLLLALSFKPDLLIMDEPTLGLDPLTRYKFLQLLTGEVAQGGLTVFLSSHTLGEVERICDTVAFIKKGKLLEVKLMEDLKKESQRIKVVFQKDVPQSALQIPGVEVLEGSGKHYLLAIKGNISHALEEISKFPIFVIEEQEISLEDIFVKKMEES